MLIDKTRRSYIWMKVKYKLHDNTRHTEKTLYMDEGQVQTTRWHQTHREDPIYGWRSSSNYILTADTSRRPYLWIKKYKIHIITGKQGIHFNQLCDLQPAVNSECSFLSSICSEQQVILNSFIMNDHLVCILMKFAFHISHVCHYAIFIIILQN